MTDFVDRWRVWREPGLPAQSDHRFGLAVDLDRCTGCGACTIACQAENNLPLVGEQDFVKAKHIKWLRLERYWEGEYPRLRQRLLPMLCQHCNEAPCETVCPVAATYHNPDGLNVQVYNRCIGTRSCAAYCPYEVRYFNWRNPQWEAPLEQQLNPEVTVRSMGVMEKCTFCVQRIRAAKDTAKDEARDLRDGDVQPACVQSCPAQALVFGDYRDHESRLSRQAQSPRAFHVLAELNTKPAVVYLHASRHLRAERRDG